MRVETLLRFRVAQAASLLFAAACREQPSDAGAWSVDRDDLRWNEPGDYADGERQPDAERAGRVNLIEEHEGDDWFVKRCYVYGANANELVAGFDGECIRTRSTGRNTSHITGDDGVLLEQSTYGLEGASSYFSPDSGGFQLMASNYDTRFLFGGSQYLAEANVYNMRNRVYHVDLNRFLQTDPIGFKGDALNLYRYCGNDPVDRSDPDGTIAACSRLMLWQGGGDRTVSEQLATKRAMTLRSNPLMTNTSATVREQLLACLNSRLRTRLFQKIQLFARSYFRSMGKPTSMHARAA